MRLRSAAAALLASGSLFLGGCPKGGTPASPVSGDGGSTKIEVSCAALEHKVSVLYKEAAESSGLAPNLHSEFVSANLQMVMNDCKLRPAVRAECLEKASSVPQMEAECLEFLDDQGTVEGYRFAGGQ